MTTQAIAAITAGEPYAFAQVEEHLSPQSNTGKPRWLNDVYHQLKQLEGLKNNWDCRGSAGVSTDALVFALEVLGRVMPPCGPAPSIHALGHGGIQLSWSSPVAELDLEVIAPNKLLVCYSDLAAHTEQEWPATNELSRLEEVLWDKFAG